MKRRYLGWTLAVGLTGMFTAGCGVPVSTFHPISPGAVTSPKGPPSQTASVTYGEQLTGNTTTLQLARTQTEASSEIVPADMPNTQVSVRLPLYPGAQSTTQSFDTAQGNLRMSPYLVFGAVKYVLPCDMKSAKAWYGVNLPLAGYKQSQAGEFNSIHEPQLHTEYVTFTSSQAPDLWVEVAFMSLPTGKTMMQYNVSDILVPDRPASTKLPSDVTQVEVTYHPRNSLTTHKVLNKTVTDPATIAKWIAEINGLPRDTRGVHGGLMDSGQAAELVFVTQNGHRISVSIHPAAMALTVNNGPGLMVGHMWDMVTQVMDPQDS